MWKEGNKTREEKKRERERERKENAHRMGKKNKRLIFLLFVGVKLKILKLTFNTINCLMKHNNLSC